jgi:hypothetical protein
MKKYIPILLFIIIPLFYSCVSSDQPNYAHVFSSITALNNGQNWTVNLTDTLTKDTMVLHAQWKHEIFRIKFPVTSSAFALTGNGDQYFNTDNSGNITKTFKLDKNYANTVTSIQNVTVNSLNKYVTGQFKMRFVIDPTGINTDTTGTDTVTLTNGRFTATYK